MSGPSRSVAEQPQHVELAVAQRLDQTPALTGARSSAAVAERRPGVDGRSPGRSRVSRPPRSRAAIGWPFVRRRPGRSPPARPASARAPAARAQPAMSPRAWWASACSTRISMTLPVLPAVLGRLQQALQESDRLAGARPSAVLGQEHPGQGDVLELAQVAEVVVGGQAPLARPAERFAQPPLRDQHPCPQRRDGPHVRGRSRRRTARSASSSRSSAPSRSPSASRIRAIATRQRYGFCGKPGVLAQLLARAAGAAWRHADRCARGGARSCPRTCPPFPAAPAPPCSVASCSACS